MPPPNTPNEPSGASSPTSTRPSRTHTDPSRNSARSFSSDSFVRDLETILAGPSSPSGSTSGSATPSMSTTPTGADEQDSPGVRLTQLYERSPPRRTTRVTRTPNTSGPRWTPTYLPLQTSEFESETQSPPDEAISAGSSQISGPRIDWQGLEYVGQVDDNLLCGICKTPYHKPTTTKACGHTFCEACLYQALEEARGRSRNRAPCPLCRTEMNVGEEKGPRRFVRVVEMSAQLDRLEVHCPNDAQLCKWTGPRSNVEAHVHNDCEYTLYPCADSSCGKMIIRKSRGAVCRHHEGPCAYCGETIDLSTEDQHHMNACTKYRAACEYCGKEFARDTLAAHGEACGIEMASCSYSKLGCSYSSLRKDVIEHEKTCDRGAFMELMDGLEKRLKADMTQMKTSLTTQMEQRIQREKRQLDTRLQELQDELQEERRKREELARNLSRLETGDLRLLRYRDPLASSVTAGEATNQEGRSSLPIPADTDFEQAEYMFRMFDELDTRISNISKALIDQDARHSVMLLNELMPVKEQLVEARSQLGVMGMHVRWLMDLQRSRQRQTTDVVGGLGAAAAGAGSSGSSAANSDAQSGSVQTASGTGAGGTTTIDSSAGLSRRVSDRVSPVRPSL
ncbi:E3 ubiquitin-protein ligase NRDP1 [Diaporthe amygdali]|uniref:E3 ubiquitin-protein ligase NRDP1 n=1 Tax=Phomopsis amygdali TaxID=1214568 RepID=UPI0022FDBFBB|nr:E3 ubiquitin-protein ligase NRDP1 [Diaporthe amygdali]KAJ0124694.1 E3 ubiquitin-protein ligase NRDP1 [Diaporthe amygdali]